MDFLKLTEKFKIYKLAKDRRKVLVEKSLKDSEDFLKNFVIWTEKLYAEIAKRVNHTIGYNASATWDPGNILDGDEVAVEITVVGARLEDFAIASFSLDVSDLQLTADITADNTVTVVLSNSTGGAVNLGSGTLRTRVWKR